MIDADNTQKIVLELQEIKQAILALNPDKTLCSPDWEAASAFVFDAQTMALNPVFKVNHIPLKLLHAIPSQKETLWQNSWHLAQGLPANNVLLWGARGTGKSSLVKAVHAQIIQESSLPLKLIEINREDINFLPQILRVLRQVNFPIIIFCDDLSFEQEDIHYKSLKALLDGGIEGRPDHVVLYATSNRRHLISRTMMENEQSTAINPSEVIEEKISLSDRFGLWVGFHRASQDDFLSMIATYIDHYNIPIAEDIWHPMAIEWSRTRASFSGRAAFQFIHYIAAIKAIRLP